mmetsp:Transcript_6159/g.7633  ORF Transcript_6159/g.7633 Transcript_6159/m.7633 type:complete len:242 (-) Transcript_6159:141-866(-)
MISMKHQVQTHCLLKAFILVHSQHLSEVGSPVQVLVVGRHHAIMKGPTVDLGCNDWDFGNDVQAIFQSIGPIVILLHALLILLKEFGVFLQGQHCHRQLRHGMGLLWQGLNGGNDIGWDVGALVEFLGEALDLLLAWHLSRDQQPKGALWQCHAAAGSFGQFLVHVVQGQMSVGNTHVGVQVRGLGDHGLHRAGAIDGHLHGDVLNLSLTMVLQQKTLEGGLLSCKCCNLGFHGFHHWNSR